MAIVGSSAVARATSLHFSTTKTLRNQFVNPKTVKADYVIDLNGAIYSNRTPPPGQAHVVLIGGLDTFIHAKKKNTPVFYMTEQQKVTLYGILRELAKKTNTATISSDNNTLETIAKAIYTNYCG